MGVALNFTATLVTECCYRCAVQFAMPDSLRNELLKDRAREFYCPNGHSQHYLGQTEEQKLRDQLEAKERELEWTRRQRDRNEAQRRAAVGQMTKLRKRIGNGVCPCCNRSFADLRRHMDSKHPDYRKPEGD